MKALAKKSGKIDRERKVLFGLIEYYLKTAKPVGSNTLKDAGFEDLSSATIRNYFANLEKSGYLAQQHSSGGRIPTEKAFRLYAEENLEAEEVRIDEQIFKTLQLKNEHEVAAYLQLAVEKLSLWTNCAVSITAPRFDQDFVVTIKLLPIDHSRCIAVILTDFGVVQTEIIHTDRKLTAFCAGRLESYFHWRLTGQNKPENLDKEEESLANNIYNEIMVRYIVGYSNFSQEEIYQTGFSKLLNYMEFHDPIVLTNSISLFENLESMRKILNECCKSKALKFWIGEDLLPYTTNKPDCAVIAIPFMINKQVVGSVAILGPVRLPYKKIFGQLREFSECLSEALTQSVFKYKISFRQPREETYNLAMQSEHLRLLEDKST